MSAAGTLVRRAVKTAALPAGLARGLGPRDAVVLLYHRVGPGRSQIETDPGVFADQMAIVAERGRATGIDRAIAGDGGTVVTFDDGTRDFHERALPVIVDRGIPVVLYVATAGIGAEGLTWSQLREAVGTGFVTVGSHTHHHVDLSRADPATIVHELRVSTELIEDRLGVPCDDFAYPFAVGSVVAAPLVRRAFRSAVLRAWRTARWPFDPHAIGRIPVLRSDGIAFFRAKLAGRLDAEGAAYRLAGRGPWRTR